MEFSGRSVAQGIQAIEHYVPETGPFVATILGFVAVAVSLWLFVKWFTRPMGERLKPVFEAREKIAILMHPNPDPDAMASAMGLAHLASTVDTDCTIQYPGQIRHQENRVFLNVLDPEFERITRVDEIAADDVVLVDHDTPRGFEGSEKIMPIAVIDHHPGNGTGLDFTDKRTEYGSCASIVAEYLRDVGATPIRSEDAGEDPQSVADGGSDATVVPPEISTGLMYGIHSDTDRFTLGATDADFDSASYLCRGVDEALLGRIANPEVDTEVLEIKSRAIADRDVRGSFIVSDVGEIKNTDAIPQAANELILLEGATAAVVYGSRNDMIHVSGRSRDDRVHMGDALAALAADVPEANGGGHSRMGGGKFPAPELAADGGDGDPSQGPLSGFGDDVFAVLEGDM
ncbi:MAG: DHH family phosphoesterase [Halobacteriota archaeon]|uniref:DHH family phosphoesterase n=1 Tax=Natronomonas sp. TaxID=2184060 RepID=UPI003976F574